MAMIGALQVEYEVHAEPPKAISTVTTYVFGCATLQVEATGAVHCTEFSRSSALSFSRRGLISWPRQLANVRIANIFGPAAQLLSYVQTQSSGTLLIHKRSLDNVR